MSTILTVKAVEEMIIDCLFSEDKLAGLGDEIPKNAVIVEGVVNKFGFDPEKLTDNKAKIIELLSELPTSFMANGGGGDSFLNACVDKANRHWGEHRSVEHLFMLGVGIGCARAILPRQLWRTLPGGVPYYIIKLDGFGSDPS